MIGLLYLPVLAAIHFTSASALGAMSVLAAKAVCDMRCEDRRRAR
jgi:hypothetical protein